MTSSSTPSTSTSSDTSVGPSGQSSQDRNAYVATLGFPLLVILGGVIGFLGAGDLSAATAGERVTVTGVQLTGIATTCQQGVPLRVVSIAPA